MTTRPDGRGDVRSAGGDARENPPRRSRAAQLLAVVAALAAVGPGAVVPDRASPVAVTLFALSSVLASVASFPAAAQRRRPLLAAAAAVFVVALAVGVLVWTR